MRKKNQKQMPLVPAKVDHPHAMELELISRILDDIPIINELAWQDLTQTQNPRLVLCKAPYVVISTSKNNLETRDCCHAQAFFPITLVFMPLGYAQHVLRAHLSL